MNVRLELTNESAFERHDIECVDVTFNGLTIRLIRPEPNTVWIVFKDREPTLGVVAGNIITVGAKDVE